MDSYSRTIINLKVLAQVKDHQRLYIDNGVFSIEQISTNRASRLWNWIARSMSNQSRSQMLTHMTFLATDCERWINAANSDDNIADIIENALPGLESLKRTYIKDITTTASIEFIESRFKRMIESSQ